jgi:ABC-type multidrug transport system ATPase subunit
VIDESTPGLDRQTTWLICNLLRRLADGGLSILCTIHQPSALAFQSFDNLLILQGAGTPAYFGDIVDNGSSVIMYFEDHRVPNPVAKHRILLSGYLISSDLSMRQKVIKIGEQYGRSLLNVLQLKIICPVSWSQTHPRVRCSRF